MICYSKIRWIGPLPFSARLLGRIPLDVAGIYLLHLLTTRYGGYATFYVGKSKNLRRRLLAHRNVRSTKPLISAAQTLGSTYWSAASIADGDVIDAIESGLVRTLRPICNAQTPRAGPIFVNLPPLLLTNVFDEGNDNDC